MISLKLNNIPSGRAAFFQLWKLMLLLSVGCLLGGVCFRSQGPVTLIATGLQFVFEAQTMLNKLIIRITIK